ncbi:MAG: potassium transporter TrkG, partial [Myxococcota bacterium]
VYRSIAIVFVAALAVALFLVLLATTQPKLPFEALLFEVVSALGTVGLSLGVTSQLNAVGQTLIIVLMYLGRLGPLTLALAVAERPVSRGYRLPEGHLAVG